MRYAFQLVLATGAIFAATAGSDAQDEPNANFSKTNVFTFAPAPSKLTKIPRDDIDKVLNASGTPTLRPNTATELYLWVLNPTEDEKKVVVELKGAKGSIYFNWPRRPSRARCGFPSNFRKLLPRQLLRPLLPQLLPPRLMAATRSRSPT